MNIKLLKVKCPKGIPFSVCHKLIINQKQKKRKSKKKKKTKRKIKRKTKRR
jgi:hypothetical protein